MAKAYKCDNCLDLYEGTPAYKEGRIELCSKCVRAIKAFQGSKPFSESDENQYELRGLNMKEIDILRFRCDYEIILSAIKEILDERNQKLENITFKFEKTTLGEEVEVHGYKPNGQVLCRIFIKYEDLVERLNK